MLAGKPYNNTTFRSNIGASFRFVSGHDMKVKCQEADGADTLLAARDKWDRLSEHWKARFTYFDQDGSLRTWLHALHMKSGWGGWVVYPAQKQFWPTAREAWR